MELAKRRDTTRGTREPKEVSPLSNSLKHKPRSRRMLGSREAGSIGDLFSILRLS
jgi:hypothetical protein